ncbi:hypothetical protein JCM9140_2861 [Halalkalibacter wakoensis JCM 9140]|uniref:Uncharacterized protein n=1 Tax=Halalkalibacter wakoensis JCM 9140 TaxID=1236970 RepID=W4Q3V5_9BACI|nr:hypothetical protein [Halalkalibacter wakoensis]GAE26766.1 hypothetical protein JCM9140_2861 [Halalkalibacter wakoensis JCM 9140]
MINYRWIKAALKKKSWLKWGLIGLDILFTFLFLIGGAFALFIVTFMYFPFAP